MVVVGADVHKRTHTFVAVDGVGKQVGQMTVAATTAGHRKALGWARREFGDELTWAIEDCRHTCPRGWSGTCSAPGRRWCGCRRR